MSKSIYDCCAAYNVSSQDLILLSSGIPASVSTAMSSAVSSQRWSCATLDTGMDYVMKDVNGSPVVDADLAELERQLLSELKDHVLQDIIG